MLNVFFFSPVFYVMDTYSDIFCIAGQIWAIIGAPDIIKNKH